VLRTLALCVAVALTGGCNRPNWDTPVSAYQSFLRALSKGEAELAYSALSAPTRELLAARAKQISEASGGSVRNDPAAIFFVNAAKAPPVTDLKVVSQEGEQATLAIAAGGKTHQVRMVREGGAWRIDLASGASPAQFEPADAGTAESDAGQQ